MNDELHCIEAIGGAYGSWSWANEIGEDWALEVYRASYSPDALTVEDAVLAAKFADDKF